MYTVFAVILFPHPDTETNTNIRLYSRQRCNQRQNDLYFLFLGQWGL